MKLVNNIPTIQPVVFIIFSDRIMSRPEVLQELTGVFEGVNLSAELYSVSLRSL